jgi:hypothetical protein
MDFQDNTMQVQLRLPEKDWKKFCDALDSPPKTIPALRQLLTTRGPFDGNSLEPHCDGTANKRL